MKRRVNTLSSSTSSKAVKRGSWKDEKEPTKKHEREDSPLGGASDSDDGRRAPPPPNDSAPLVPGAASSNPVVWLDVSVAGRPRGRIHIELFKDLVPIAAENFRKLCAGIDVGGKKVSYAGIEFDSITLGGVVEGDVNASVDLEETEGPDDCALRHAKGGLLSMEPSLSGGSYRFQLTLAPAKHLDGKQLVFGQVVASPPLPLGFTPFVHPLHWVEAVGSSNGEPWEAVVVEACDECGPTEVDAVLGAMVVAAQVDRVRETQDDRYGRAGVSHSKLQDSISDDAHDNALELTDDVLAHLEYEAKKARQSGEKDRAAVKIEKQLKWLAEVVRHVEKRSNAIDGADGTVGRSARLNATKQLTRVRDLEQSLIRML